VILGLRHYPTSPRAREPLLRFMLDSLLFAGCRILFASAPNRAPFVITFETPDGQRLGIVAYAFLATRTPTRNRPQDERSFQVKYGAKEQYAHENTHTLWQDPLGLFTTLLIGIDTKEGFFVSALTQRCTIQRNSSFGSSSRMSMPEPYIVTAGMPGNGSDAPGRWLSQSRFSLVVPGKHF